MATSNIATVVLLLLWFLSAANGDSMVVCNEKERRALLSFKQGLTDPMNMLSSWSVQEDCCKWIGVRCDNITGRVIQLDLKSTLPYQFKLGGKISPSLVELEFLNYLDLSWNHFGGTRIPTFLGSIGSLRHLALYSAGFVGRIPPQLGNLSSLSYLHLGGNYDLYVDNLSWISCLSSLEYLNMISVDLHREVNWLQASSVLPSLSQLYLSSCQLGSMTPPLGYVNFTSLVGLDLSHNLFIGEIPNWFFNLSSSLSYLDLSANALHGQIPNAISNFRNLKHLSLYNNSFHRPIPASIGNLSSLRVLYLSRNQLNGTLPKSLWLLSNLEKLSMGDNLLAGNVSEVNFAKLSKLNTLVMSSNSFFFNANSNWVPPFQLEYLDMSSCKMGPKFPEWLQTQRNLQYLFLLKSGISGTTPNWFWKLVSQTLLLDLSYNQIDGDISTVLLNSSHINLSYNCFKGRLPHLSPNVNVLNIANNSFLGPISPFLCQNMNGKYELKVLDVSNILLSGKIPEKIGGMKVLESLDLSRNHLLGEIPQSISNLMFLSVLNLSHNNFSGRIPSSTQLQSFNATSYAGNAELCGAPLKKNCTKAEESLGVTPVGENGEEFEMPWFYIGMGTGFAISFWGFLGVLLFKRTWRHAYFQFLDDIERKNLCDYNPKGELVPWKDKKIPCWSVKGIIIIVYNSLLPMLFPSVEWFFFS